MTFDLWPAAARGRTAFDWLESRHSFSFAGWQHPARMGFSVLRVINDDIIAPGSGFPTHGHRDMEIVTWVTSGVLRHADSTGASGFVRSGEIQRMRAGTGIRHSEYNASDTAPLRLFQIWLLPARAGLDPGYEQISPQVPVNRLCPVAAPDGREGAATIAQDAVLYVARLSGGGVAHRPASGRRLYLHVAEGEARVGERTLAAGDGAAISGCDELTVHGAPDARVLLFDLP